jgi:small nuclear ribonucleoprotein (snRNP)-like protein
MPQKRTPRRKSGPRLPKSEPIPLHTKNLEKALNSMVVVYVVNNGTPLRGLLREYDKETIVISPETTIHREKIVAFYQAKNAPTKAIPRPPVR